MADGRRERMAQAVHQRVGLLVSVRSLAEAEVALANGADLIDLKEPSRGALGAVEQAVVALVVSTLGGQRPVSATVGDHPATIAELRIRVERLAARGVDYVKVGLPGGSQDAAIIEHLAPLAASGICLIAVMSADRGLPGPELVDHLAAAGFAGAMLDTEDKSAGSLCCILSFREIAAFCTLIRCRGLLLGLAGSLRLDDIQALVALKPDYLGFRGALCHHDRTGNLDATLVTETRQRLNAELSEQALSRTHQIVPIG